MSQDFSRTARTYLDVLVRASISGSVRMAILARMVAPQNLLLHPRKLPPPQLLRMLRTSLPRQARIP